MSAKDHALTAFRNQSPQRAPVCPFLGGSWPLSYSGRTLEELIGDAAATADIFYRVNEELDGDIVTVGAGATALTIRALGGEIRFDSRGAPSIVGELIKTEEDLERLDVAAAIASDDLEWLRQTARDLFKRAGDRRLILASGRAPFTLAGQLFGLEKLAKTMYKNKDFVHRLLETTTAISIGYFQSMLETGAVHGAFIADPSASGDVISKRHFEEFVFPYLKRVVDVIKQFNSPVMLHICGDITDRLTLIADAGIDSLSLDTKVNIAQAKAIVGDRICLAGNVDPVNVLEFGTIEDVRIATRACMEEGARNGGFIVMPGCDFSSGVSVENLRALAETSHRWSG